MSSFLLYPYTYTSQVQTGLILCQGYVPEKHHANLTQNSHLQSVLLGGYGINNLILCTLWLTTSGHMDLFSIYVLYIQYTYISIQYLYLFLIQYKCKRLTSIILGMVHSDRTVVVLQHKHFSSWHGTFCNSITTTTNCNMIIKWANLTLWHMSTICSSFSSWLITSNFYSILTVFRWIFTWIALGDVDIRFSLILVRKANTASAAWFYHQCNETIPMIDGVTTMSHFAVLQHKTSAARDHLCQIVLNQKLLHIIYTKSY
jgi:hypothetical protein